MKKTYLIFWLYLCFVATTQAEESFASHFNKALEYLDEAISEAMLIEQEELRISAVSILEHEKEMFLHDEFGRIRRGLYLSKHFDEIICECNDEILKKKIGNFILLMAEELEKSDVN